MWTYWLCSYVLGTFLSAYVIGRLNGVQLEQEGSGNLGARNAGRVLGKWAFFVVTLLDGLKGAVVVVVGHMLELPITVIVIALLFVTIGHIYPFWRRFQGGKGVATGIGGLLFVSPLSIVLLALGFMSVFLLTKSSTKGMIGALVVYGVYFSVPVQLVSGLIWGVIIVILWANRENIQERMS